MAWEGTLGFRRRWRSRARPAAAVDALTDIYSLASDETYRGGFLEIAGGDLQYLHYVDRSTDMIIRGGMKISAAELEGFITSHPSVGDVAVVAYPDEVLGERACAVLVPRPGRSSSANCGMNCDIKEIVRAGRIR